MRLFLKLKTLHNRSPSSARSRHWGQGLVEFALMLPILLIILFILVEAAFIIQGYLAVQHAAREAARWAVSYRPVQGQTMDEQYCTNYGAGDTVDAFLFTDAGTNCDPTEGDSEWYARRVALIKETAVQRAAGLRINRDALGLTDADFAAYQNTAGFYGVRVSGSDWYGNMPSDFPGLPGLPVQVEVVHRVELVDPFLRAVAPNGVRVRARANMVNEGVQVGQASPTPYTATPHDFTPPPTPISDDTPTPTHTPTPRPTSTPPVGGYCLELSFETVTNTLPYDRGHLVEATVYEGTCGSGARLPDVVVSFSTNAGAYHYSGEDAAVYQYAEAWTGDTGVAARRIYANETVTASLRAWVDLDGDDTYDAGEATDTATKIWVAPPPNVPYILASSYYVYPEDWITADLYQHPQDQYTLLWCRTSITGGVPSAVLSTAVDVGPSGQVLDLPVTIPADSSGYYRLETHDDGTVTCEPPGSGCSAVACSDDIYVVPGRPDLAINSINIPSQIQPETLFTMSVVIENLTAGLTNELFDVDFYVDPAEEPSVGSIGVVKQWVSGIDPFGNATLNTVMWVGELGVHEIWVRVDTSNYIDEEAEDNNVGMVTFSAICPLGEENGQVIIPAASYASNSAGICTGAHQWEVSGYGGRATMLALPDVGQGCYSFFETTDAPLLRYNVHFDQPGRYYVWALGRPCIESGRDCGTLPDGNNSFWVTLNGLPDTNDNYRITGWSAGGFTWESSIQGAFGQPYLDVPSAGNHQVQVRMREDGFEWATIVLTTTAGSDGEPEEEDLIVTCGAGDPPPWPPSDAPGLLECTQLLEVGDFEGNPDRVFSSWGAGGAGAFQRTGYFQYEGAFSMRLHASLGSYPACSALSPWLAQTVQIPTEIYTMTSIVVEGYRTAGGSLADCSVYDSVDYDDGFYVQLQSSAGSPSEQLWPPAGFSTPTPPPPPTATPPPTPTSPPTVILDVDFDADEDGFSYVSEAFDTPSLPGYDTGAWLFSGGATGGGLQVELGDIDNVAVDDMSGGWQRSFNLGTSTGVRISLLYQLTQSSEYEQTECSQVLLSVDGTLHGAGADDYVVEICGDELDPNDVTTGWQTFEVDVGNLSAGDHTITVGGYNNRKTYNNEWTEVLIDDVLVLDVGTLAPTPTPEPPASPYENWAYFEADFTDDVDLPSLAGEDVQIRFYGNHDSDEYGTWFYVDEVECNVCTEWPVPDEVAGTASIGGLVRATVGGVPQLMTNVEVVAYSRGGQVYRTRSIHDGTYHFYNIPPGTYHVYAETYIGGVPVDDTVTVTVVTDQRNFGVNLLLGGV